MSNKKIQTKQGIKKIALLLRRQGKKIVFTNGCFDLLHIGHIDYLAQARTYGDILIVGLNSDSSVRQLKGPTRPIISQQERAAVLAALAAVDYVVIFSEETPLNLLKLVRPDILVKGGDYKKNEVVGRELVESYGGKVIVTKFVNQQSSSQIIQSIKKKS